MQRELSVGEVAKRSGVAVSALHFYERKGLIRSLRTAGNQRRYARDVLRRIAVIRVAQRLGVPLQQVLEAFSVLPEQRTPHVRSGRACRRAGADNWMRALANYRRCATSSPTASAAGVCRCAAAG